MNSACVVYIYSCYYFSAAAIFYCYIALFMLLYFALFATYPCGYILLIHAAIFAAIPAALFALFVLL